MKVGYLHFKISGTDGVSLEMAHWKNIIESLGHTVTFVAGILDTKGILIPELHFEYPKALEIHNKIVNGAKYEDVADDISQLAEIIENKLIQVLKDTKFDKLIVSNIFSLPMNPSATVALYNVLNKVSIPTLAIHHDFWWERTRYLNDGFEAFFNKYFPPRLGNISHVTINKASHDELLRRTGLDSTIFYDCFDFKRVSHRLDAYSSTFKSSFGISSTDKVILNASRLVPRKNIELTLELVKQLNDPHVVLVLSGYSGDEGHEYVDKLRKMANDFGVRVLFIGDRILRERSVSNGLKYFTIYDCYLNADFTAYTTVLEGFGNQFVEAIAYKKPILVNRYAVYKTDIEPMNFNVVSIDGAITSDAVSRVRELLHNRNLVKKVTGDNFRIGKNFFDYSVISKQLVEIGFLPAKSTPAFVQSIKRRLA